MQQPTTFFPVQAARSGTASDIFDDTIAVLEAALCVTPNIIIVSSYRPRLSHELGNGEVVDDHDDTGIAVVEATYSRIMDYARQNRLPVCIPSMPGTHFKPR